MYPIKFTNQHRHYLSDIANGMMDEQTDGQTDGRTNDWDHNIIRPSAKLKNQETKNLLRLIIMMSCVLELIKSLHQFSHLSTKFQRLSPIRALEART